MTTPPAMPELPDGATVLPDGSAFAIASFPLPSDHWLYAPREYRDGEEEPIELPSPILSHQAHGDIVRAAIRYAVRSATMCGKEPDFDPDALVQNAMYALCGPFGGATMQAQPTPTEHIKEPYTLAELNERIASNDYNAELLLQHAMLLLNAKPVEVSDAQIAAGMRELFAGPKPWPSWEVTLKRVYKAMFALRPQAESEPFGYFRALPFGWEQCSETDEGAVALYERPQSAQQAVQMTWPQTRDVGRFGDMSKSAHMRVGLDSDNDVYVSVWDEDGGGSVEFCNPGGGGGGSSRRTREALIALMVAMEADNAERPDKDWWSRRNGITAPAGGEVDRG